MAARLALISEASEEEILEIPKLYEKAKKENLMERGFNGETCKAEKT